MTSRTLPIPSSCFCMLMACILIAATHATPLAREEDYDPNPEYSFAYDVNDAATGDIKSHQETRQGGVVRGSYSLVEADGSRRTVHYSADAHRGFQVVVHREVNTHPGQQRLAVLQQVPIPQPVAPTPVTDLPTTTTEPTTTSPAPAEETTPPSEITPAPANVVRPVLLYVGVQPSHRFVGAPYYQLQLAHQH